MTLLVGCLLVFVGIPIFINWVFSVEPVHPIFAVKWTEAEALSYTAGSLAFIGTTYLGFVSWKQNHDLQKIEKRNFISQNSCLDMVTEVSIEKLHMLAVDLENRPEQIVKSDKLRLNNDYNYYSFTCRFKMQRTSSIPAMVRVNSMIFWILSDKQSTILKLESIDDSFSRIMISEKEDSFIITVLVNSDEKEKVVKTLKEKSQLLLDINYELATANYVVTKNKCHVSLIEDMERKHVNLQDAVYVDKNPTCIWYGNYLLDEKNVKFGHENY